VIGNTWTVPTDSDAITFDYTGDAVTLNPLTAMQGS